MNVPFRSSATPPLGSLSNVSTHRQTLRGRLISAVWDFLAPPLCPACGREFLAPRENSGLTPRFCPDCIDQLAPPIEHACTICAAPVGPYVETSQGCLYCARDSFAFEKVLRVGVYRDELQLLCQQAKGTGGAVVGAALAELLFEQQRKQLSDVQADVVTAVPAHWTGRILGRHHAADTMARVLAHRMKVEFAGGALRKTRRTRPQTDLSPTERRKNLRRAFSVRDSAPFAGKTVLLVDDILTTGTTAHEASKALTSAGANEVIVAVIARGLGQPTVKTA